MLRKPLPAIGPAVPQRGWWMGRAIGGLVLAAARWSITGTIPDIGKAVLIVAPHTSNWDFVIGAAGMLALDLDLRFLGKHTLFDGPLAPLMRGLGGIPVDRSHPGSGVVQEMTDRFRAEDRMLLALSPEGTRRSVERWKTGFHNIAYAANVPIAAVALDWGRRQIRFGPIITPTDDIDHDLEVFLDFFSTARGRRGTPAASAP